MLHSSPTSPELHFFPVSTTKLAVMSVCTFGLYQIYWFYWNWRLIKRRENRRLSAPWRSVLGLFYALPLFRRMAHAAGSQRPHIASACFIAWLALSVAGYGPAPWSAVTLASVVPLLPLQALANRVNAQVALGHDRNTKLRGWNIVAVVVGGPMVALTLLGLALLAMQA